MNIRSCLIPSLILALTSGALAQPGYMRSGAGSGTSQPQKKQAKEVETQAEEPAADGEEEAPQPAPKRKKKAAKDKDDAYGNDKKSIEAYLQSRLAQLQKSYRAQESFGKRTAGAWSSHWSRVYEERKVFEVRMARQRLNIFESLASLDTAAHSQTIADFERMQANVLKSFEDSQKQKMADFFNQMMADLKQFSTEQEATRAEFMADAHAAWQSQKSGAK